MHQKINGTRVILINKDAKIFNEVLQKGHYSTLKSYS